MSEWFEDEAFWTAYAPLMFDESSWAEVPEIIDDILAISSARPESRFLDLCCGVGRHSIELASRGFFVTGVDLTRAYLQAAKESAEALGARIEFVRDDARHFSRPGAYDVCINLFTSFGYFEKREDDLRMLEKCAQNLAPGGCLVLETIGKELAARDFVARETFSKSGWNVTTEYQVVGDWESRNNRWILENGSVKIDRSFTLRLYSAFEMKEALLKAGFRQVDIHGGMDARPYDQSALTLVAVARK